MLYLAMMSGGHLHRFSSDTPGNDQHAEIHGPRTTTDTVTFERDENKRQ